MCLAGKSCSCVDDNGTCDGQEDVEWAEQQLGQARHKLAVSEKMTREIQRRLSVLKAGLAVAAPSAWRRKRVRGLPADTPS